MGNPRIGTMVHYRNGFEDKCLPAIVVELVGNSENAYLHVHTRTGLQVQGEAVPHDEEYEAALGDNWHWPCTPQDERTPDPETPTEEWHYYGAEGVIHELDEDNTVSPRLTDQPEKVDCQTCLGLLQGTRP